MKKWIIEVSDIVIATAILAMVAVTFTQESEGSDPRSSNIDLLPTEESLGTPDEAGRGSRMPKSIKEVKEAWEERLMAMPGVMGVGIGLTKDGQEKAIKVYVNRKASGQAAQIPRVIEGYPVEVEIRGIFRAW